MRLIWLVAEGQLSSSRMRPTLSLLTRSSRDGDIEPAAAGLAWGGVSNGMVRKK